MEKLKIPYHKYMSTVSINSSATVIIPFCSKIKINQNNSQSLLTMISVSRLTPIVRSAFAKLQPSLSASKFLNDDELNDMQSNLQITLF